MISTVYVTTQEYTDLGYSKITNNLSVKLREACTKINLLTFNRINGIGFENLTEYQKYIVKVCACDIAEFYEDNIDLIESVLQSYSINGVSMQFGNSWNVVVQNGVAVSRDTYKKLETTGLCRRVI